VATKDIAGNALGALAVEGIFIFPKTAGSSTAIAAGTKVYWDTINEVITATADSLKCAGYATEDASDDDTTVKVKLSRA